MMNRVIPILLLLLTGCTPTGQLATEAASAPEFSRHIWRLDKETGDPRISPFLGSSPRARR